MDGFLLSPPVGKSTHGGQAVKAVTSATHIPPHRLGGLDRMPAYHVLVPIGLERRKYGQS